LDPNAPQLSEADGDRLFEETYNKALGNESTEAPIAKVEPAQVEDVVDEVTDTVVEKPVVETKVETPAANTEQNTPDPNAWMKEIPEEARTRYIKEMQDFKANAGRNAALQRHLDAARRELESLKKPKEEPKPEPVKLDKWEALSETDKELALSVEQRIADAVAKATSDIEKKFQARVAPIEDREYEARVQNEFHLLKQAVPNYEEVVRTEHFHNWMSQQTPTTKQRYEESIDHRDALDIMRLYSLSFGNPPATQANPQPTPNPDADKVAAAREQRRQASTPVKSNAAGIPRNPNTESLSEKEEDQVFEAAFAKFTRGS
jgi:hypothetical protein